MNNLFAYVLGFVFPALMVAAFIPGINSADLKDSTKLKYKKFAVLIVSLWILLIWSLGYLGIFEYQEGDIAPRFLAGLLLPFIVGLLFFRNSNFLKVLNQTPHYAIVGIQTLRVLGISFLFIAQQGAGPEAFASAGYGDLVTGILALVAGLMLFNQSNYANGVVWAFNMAGMFDLVNVSRILLTYYPSWYEGEPSTALAGEFPTVLILCLAAPIALLFHLYSVRNLLLTRRKEKKLMSDSV